MSGQERGNAFLLCLLDLGMEIWVGIGASSGYRSKSESRGICSVRPKVFMPRAMAVWIISSRLSTA